MHASDIFLGILAIMFPPLPVWVKCGICSVDSLINILLCMLGFFPGLLHAWYIIARYPDSPYDYQPVPEHQPIPQHPRGDRITYVYVAPSHPAQGGNPAKAARGPQNHGANYGTVPGSSQNHPRTYAQATAAGASSSSGSTGHAQNHADGDAAPPSYHEAVADHKVQTRE